MSSRGGGRDEESGDRADHADLVGTADRAGNAGRAGNTDRAGNAGRAENANRGGNADRAVLRRYYGYRATVNNGFFLPVGIIYIEHQGLGLDVIGFTQGVFLLALVGFQLPTGYLGDRIGRRNTVLLGALVVTGVMVLYPLGNSLWTFTALYVAWAFGWSCREGVGEAWLYDLLATGLDPDAYASVDGRARAIELAASAVSAAIAGLLYTVDPTLPFLANAAVTAAGVPLLVMLPKAEGQVPDRRPSITAVAHTARTQLSRPDVRWFVAFLAVIYACFEVTRAFEQPAAVEVGVPVALLGVLYSAFKLVSAAGAALAGPIHDRFGVRPVFVALAPILAIAYLSAAFVPQLLVGVFFLTRSIQSVTVPVQNQYLNDRVADAGRATVLSAVSMVTALAGAMAHFVAGSIAPSVGSVGVIVGAGLACSVVAGVVWALTTPVEGPVDSPEPITVRRVP